MKFFLFFWVAVEILQVAVIGMLVIGHRRLQRRLDEDFRFTQRPPRSVTDQ